MTDQESALRTAYSDPSSISQTEKHPERVSLRMFFTWLPLSRIFHKVSARASTTAISARVMVRPGSSFPAEVPVITPACSRTDIAPRA